jgi:beta-lactamase regulating signal transducer with metallopeptidase domain
MLHTILQIGASNAISALFLAGPVVAMSLIVARPAFVRALWILVLLKLLTPPLWTVPVDDYAFRVLHPRAVRNKQPAPATNRPIATGSEEESKVAFESSPVTDDSTPLFERTVDQQSLTVAVNDRPEVPTIPFTEVIAAAWVAGSVCCVIVAVLRVRRFKRCLDLAEPASAPIDHQIAALASRLGLRRAPNVLFVQSAVCPSLWAFSIPARIVIPRHLWDRLDSAQQDAMLVHELAHLCRRDHWVRLLEVAATIVYWWHPFVWFARRQLHEAEEQCCDAWVIGLLPAARGRYAAALLETVDFLSSPHSATPALASGLGEFSRLKRRIVMIQNGRVRKALSWSGAVVVFGLASLVLPVAAGFGQDAPDKQKKAENEFERSARRHG